MRLPITNDEFNQVISIIASSGLRGCEECEKWRLHIHSNLHFGKFDRMGKDVMHLVDHLQLKHLLTDNEEEGSNDI